MFNTGPQTRRILDLFSSMTSSLPKLALFLAAAIFVNRMGGMAKLFMPMYFRSDMNLGIEVIGWLLACYGVGTLVGSYSNGVLSDFINPRRLVVILLTCSGTALFGLSLTQSVEGLAILLFLGGFFDGGVRPVVDRLIMETCSEKERPLAQSLNRVAINLAFSAAGLIAGALATFDYRAIFVFDGVCNLLAAAWLFWVFRSSFAYQALATQQLTHHETVNSPERRMPYTDIPFIIYMIATLFVALMYDTTNSLLGNYLGEYHRFGPEVFGWQCALNGILIVLFQIPLTKWTDHWGARMQVTIGVMLAGLGLAILPFCSSTILVSISTITWTVGEMLFMPTMAALVMLRAEGRRSGHYFGLQNTMWSASVLLAPIMGSQLYANFGGHVVWYMCGALGLAAMLCLFGIVPSLTGKSERSDISLPGRVSDAA